jgi:hypothetical protein
MTPNPIPGNTVVAAEHDADALTELLWTALHGLVTLARAGRLRPGYDSDRLQLLVNQFSNRRETNRYASRSINPTARPMDCAAAATSPAPARRHVTR